MAYRLDAEVWPLGRYVDHHVAQGFRRRQLKVKTGARPGDRGFAIPALEGVVQPHVIDLARRGEAHLRWHSDALDRQYLGVGAPHVADRTEELGVGVADEVRMQPEACGQGARLQVLDADADGESVVVESIGLSRAVAERPAAAGVVQVFDLGAALVASHDRPGLRPAVTVHGMALSRPVGRQGDLFAVEGEMAVGDAARERI